VQVLLNVVNLRKWIAGKIIEIETSCNTNLFDPAFDSDFDPDKTSSEAFKAYVNGVEALLGSDLA
jgi:hypothetical protein